MHLFLAANKFYYDQLTNQLKCMKKSVSFQPIGRQPPKDTSNQQQGRHAPLFSFPATRDARIKFWDFGRTGIANRSFFNAVFSKSTWTSFVSVGTIPFACAHVLPWCAGCHRGLRHHQRGHLCAGQELGQRAAETGEVLYFILKRMFSQFDIYELNNNCYIM